MHYSNLFSRIKRIIAGVSVFAFIFTQSGAGVSYALRNPNPGGNEAGASGTARAMGGEMRSIAKSISNASGRITNTQLFKEMQEIVRPGGSAIEYNESLVDEKIKRYVDPRTKREKPEYRDTVTDVIRETVQETNKNTQEKTIEAAKRAASICLNSGVKILASRHSRAFDTAAKLFANSMVAKSASLRDSIMALMSLTQKNFGFRLKKLEAYDYDLDRLSEVTFLVDLLSEDEVSAAQIKGGASRLRKQINKLRSGLSDKITVGQISSSRAAIRTERRRFLHKLEEVEEAINDIVEAFNSADKRRPIFNIELSNAFIGPDPYSVYWTNKGHDALDSPDPEMAELVKEGRPQYHATANSPEWVRFADDWVEALPAYAGYIIKDSKDGGYEVVPYIERGGMEGLYKSYGEPMAFNIEWTMQTEHAALARRLLIDRDEFQDDINKKLRAGAIDRDEAMRLVAIDLVEKGVITKTDIANVAAVIWETYFNFRPDIEKAAEEIGYEADRINILSDMIYNNRGEDNLFRVFLSQKSKPPLLKDIIAQAKETVETNKLQDEAGRIEWTVLNSLRDIPAQHVMTTLAPTETEKIVNWLEESMSLYLVSRARKLEDEAKRRQKAYGERKKAISDRLENELALDPKKPEELAMLNNEAAILFALLELERPVGIASSNPQDVGDIKEVLKYLQSRPDISDNAEADIVKKLKSKGRPDEIKEKFAAQIKGEALRRARELYIKEKKINTFELGQKIRERTDAQLAMFYLRRDLVAESNLSHELDNPRYKYSSKGCLPDWYSIYSPSRVDLGPEIVSSERDTSKVCSANHPKALLRAHKMYSLYNIDPQPFSSTAEGEFAKMGENFFSRGGVYYLSLGAGMALDSLGVGNFADFRAVWAKRGDRMPLPAGESYRGFCVPKEFCLGADVLRLAASPDTSDKLFDIWGIPKGGLRNQLMRDFQMVLNNLPLYPTEMDIVNKVKELLGEKHSEYVKIAQDDGETAIYIARLPELLILMRGMNIIQDSWLEDARKHSVNMANWSIEKLIGLEEINRIGPYRKLLKIYEALKYRWHNDEELQIIWKVEKGDTDEQKKEKFRSWMRSLKIAGCPPYKEGTQDYRFTAYGAFLEIASGLHYHIMEDLDPRARKMLMEMITDIFGSVTSPTFGGVTMVGPVGWVGVAGYMPDIPKKFTKYAKEAKDKLQKILSAQDSSLNTDALRQNWLDENIEYYGIDLMSWKWNKVFPNLTEDQLQERKSEIYNDVALQLIFLVYGKSFDEIADNVKARLISSVGIGSLTLSGNPTDTIMANSKNHGSDLREWPEIKPMLKVKGSDEYEKAERLINAIGPAINMLVSREEDVYTRNKMKYVVTRAGITNLGIPEEELLDLIASHALPATLSEMRRLQENPGFLFVDGTSGGRYPFAEFRDPASKMLAKRLFNLEPKSVYTSMGVGPREIEKWRRELAKERSLAEGLYSAIQSRNRAEAQEALDRIKKYMRIGLKRKEAIDMANVAEERKLKSYQAYKYRKDCISDLCSGRLTIDNLDFPAFLVLGGQYILDGRLLPDEDGYADITEVEKSFNTDIEAMAAATGKKSRSARSATKWFIGAKGVYIERPFEQEETGVRTSMKDVAESLGAVGEYLARINNLIRNKMLQARKYAFDELSKTLADKKGGRFSAIYQEAKAQLPRVEIGNSDFNITGESFGNFLVYTRKAYESLVTNIIGSHAISGLGLSFERRKEARKLAENIDKAISDTFKGGVVTSEEYTVLAQLLGELAGFAQNDREKLERVAQMGELLDIAFVIENCFNGNVFEVSPERGDNTSAVWQAIGGYMDKTINNHIFDYWPMHIDPLRGSGFESYTRDEKFALAARIHKDWLYPFIRWTIVNKTEMKLLGQQYADTFLGYYENGGIKKAGLGINMPAGEDDQLFWYSYARLRDVSIQRVDNNPLPELLLNVPPDVIDAENRINISVIYPWGNTTQPFAYKKNPQENKTGVNLLNCAFPEIDRPRNSDKEYLRMRDAFTWMSKDDYRKALIAAGVETDEIKQRLEKVYEEKGISVMMSFSRPVTADAVWFHTFNINRTRIDNVEAALIQPFLWEAATHLKCFYREMYEESGVVVPAQKEFYMSRAAIRRRFGGVVPQWLIDAGVPAEDITRHDQKEKVKKAIVELHNETGCGEVVVKFETQSGGRKMLTIEIFDEEKGKFLDDKIDYAAEQAVDMLEVDDVVVQAFIRTKVNQLFSKEFISGLRERMATEIGKAVDSDTAIFSYARTIVASAKDEHPEVERARSLLSSQVIDGVEYFITQYIGVASTEAVANVGRGGRLFMLTPDDKNKKLNSRYREDILSALNEASFMSMSAQRDYLRRRWKKILADYLKHRPEFATDPDIVALLDASALPDKYFEIPYELGDYISKWIIDEEDNLRQVYNRENAKLIDLYDSQGKWTGVEGLTYADGKPVMPDKDGNVKLYDKDGVKQEIYFKDEPVRTLVWAKMEPNPLAGLWGPHALREAVYDVPADEAGTYWIYQLFARNAKPFKDASYSLEFIKEKTAAAPVYIGSMQTEKEASVEQLALKSALKQLNLISQHKMMPSDFSVLFEHYLALANKGALDSNDAEILMDLFGGENAILVRKLLIEPEFEGYRQRVIAVVKEINDINKSGMPGLRIRPSALSDSEAKSILDPQNRTNVAVVFSGPATLMPTTVARLQQDADKAFENGDIIKRINVIGVPADALLKSEKGNVKNIICASSEIDVVELSLAAPIQINWIMPRNLAGPNELIEHEEIADFADTNNIPVSCNSETAAVADNKAATKTVLGSALASHLIDNNNIGTAEKEIKYLTKTIYYIQPASGGTEGRGVKAFSKEESAEALKHIETLLKEYPQVLIREVGGNVFYAADDSTEPVNVTFRINAGFDGEKAFAETGYAQVASSENPLITSVEQGGRIEDINIALHSLKYKDVQGRWQKFNPTIDEIKRIKRAAGNIAKTLDIKYGGVDFVLEVDQNSRLSAIIPLEMNARGVLSPSVKILETETLPADYRTFRHRELAPAEFWQMVEKDAAVSVSAIGSSV